MTAGTLKHHFSATCLYDFTVLTLFKSATQWRHCQCLFDKKLFIVNFRYLNPRSLEPCANSNQFLTRTLPNSNLPLTRSNFCFPSARGGGYSHTLPIRVCAAQRGRDFEAPDLERGIHFRGIF